MKQNSARVNGIYLHYTIDGSGPPLVLLHGYPQTSYMWRKVMPALAESYTVIAPDMRGYGASDKPLTGYDKRTMASDIRELVHQLGFERIRLAGHDRGARVAHRYAKDHGDELDRLVILDIIPTQRFFELIDKDTAISTWHWFFQMVPDLPEILVSGNVQAYLDYFFHAMSYQRSAFPPEDVEVYVRAFSQPGALRAAFSDYRAGGTIDLEQDAEDGDRKITVPTLVLWGNDRKKWRSYSMMDIWREMATNVRGEAIPECGHYLAEEQPEIVAAKMLEFLA